MEQILGLTEASIYPDFDGFARLHVHDKPYIEPDPIGFWVRGIYAHQANDLDDAIEYYTEVIQLDPEDSSIVTAAYHQRGNAHIEKRVIDSAIWEKAKSDLTTAKDMEGNIISQFLNHYKSVLDFEQKHGVKLPEDIASMRTSL